MAGHADAVAALHGAARIEAAARGRSRWYAVYLWVLGAWQLAFVPAVVLWHGPAGTGTSCAMNAALVSGLSVYAARQPVVPRGFARRHYTVIGTWAALYVLTIMLSVTVGRDSVPFAAVAAPVCALPFAVAAVGVMGERRRRT
ncbi:hypothetical protein [Streptomyces sp. AV19]|uniref:hypothetical protein n=1 Tax=Streptomyces sp. AV19 TaxID=2793068 RepID=UPI001F17BE45|nr:hypothetical protein [Streptomyces sp. AV19]MDG4536248.1 hypothetical protein [Streptomyces sp. AV19]